MTNREKINNMTNKELADFFNFEDLVESCDDCILASFCDEMGIWSRFDGNCNGLMEAWLESEVRKNDNNKT